MYRDFEACWRASESRDRRFDGRFFIGVHTTGVYCRPVCPAPSPKRENVRFYPTAAAAEGAELRPCRRCRPETAPGTPEWLGGPAVVARGLRLIGDGFLDRRGVRALAHELCLGERQLRRLFVTHLGASPLAVARTRRVQLARLRLAYRPPLAWEQLLGFLAARAVPGVEEVRGHVYRRTVGVGEATGLVEVEPGRDAAELVLRVKLSSLDGLPVLVERARQAFDLGADPLQIGGALGGDPRLGALVACVPGLRVPGTFEPFELTVRAILGQQVSVRAATTLAGRLVERFGEALPEADGGLARLFPTAEALTRAEIEAIGVPGARAETIRRLARAVAEGLELGPTSSPEDVRTRLAALPGIGPWTVEYVAMRALRDPDAFPASDLGLRYALSRNGRPATAAEVAQQSAVWRPWRAYAALYLWESLAEPARAAE